jgi:hypothetical protein
MVPSETGRRLNSSSSKVDEVDEDGRKIVPLRDRIDCAYHTIKKLSSIWSLYEKKGIRDNEDSDRCCTYDTSMLILS